jgi:outer membrane protein assembly factor BamB
MKQQNRWTSIGKDHTLTGNAGITGSMTRSPQEFFSLDVASRHIYVAAALDGSDCQIEAAYAGTLSSRTDLELYKKWQAGYPEFHENGEQPLFSEYDLNAFYYFGKVGHFIPGVKELQWMECDTCFDGPYGSRMRAARNETEYLFARMKVLRDGRWENLWETGNIDYLACGQPAISDFDGDGELEVAVTPWYFAHFYDLKTGREKYVCPAKPEGTESGRVYGLTMASDIDGDGINEVITMSGMENHVNMLKYSDGKIQKIWSFLIERGSMNKSSIHHLTLDPAADIDGDGIKEICLAVYNHTGDHRWHLLVLNGMTGELRLDYPGFYLKQVKTVEGCSYLFGYRTEHLEQGDQMEILEYSGGTFQVLFDKRGCFAETTIMLTEAHLGHHPLRPLIKIADVTDAKGTAFFTRESLAIKAYRFGRGGIQPAGSILGACEADLASVISSKGTALLKLTVPVGETMLLEGCGVELNVVGRTAGSFYGAQPLVADYADGKTRVIAQTDHEQVDVFTLEGDVLRKDFSINGRGTRPHSSWPYTKGPILADICGNTDYALMVFVNENSQGALAAFNKEGGLIWKRIFDDIPFEMLISFCKGKIRGGDGEDILVFAEQDRGRDVGIALDGRTGEIIWQRERGVPAFPKGSDLPFGGMLTSIEDIDGDGESEIPIVYPYHFALHKAKTGERIKYINTMDWSDYELFPKGCQGMYAVLPVGDFLGNGKKQYLYTGTNYAMSLIDVSGEGFVSLWPDVHPMWNPDTLPGIGDIDGDGRTEVFSPGWRTRIRGHEGSFRCFDIATGQEKWSFPTEAACFGYNVITYWNSPTMTVTSDLNGDGRDECYYGAVNKLYCVGVPKGKTAGRILWSKEFPDRISHPTPAWINNRAALIVTCADGKIYMVR